MASRATRERMVRFVALASIAGCAFLTTVHAAPIDRDAYFTRMLAPTAGAVADIPDELRTKKPKDVTEAAASFERGLVYVSQGAWKEAEKELHNAEKKADNKSQTYALAAAYAYLKLHRSDDAFKRYEKYYKLDPTNRRALVGMAAAYEDMQRYVDAVRIWMRVTKMPLAASEKASVDAMLAGARDLFAANYEIAENPAGGAKNLATPEQELAWGFAYAQQLSSTGVPLLQDESITSYVKSLCQQLVASAKRFPTNYEVFVLDSATVNAMTTPGYIFVYRGILDAVKSENELAGVLGHEIGHSVAHHVAKSQTKAALDQQQVEKLKASNSKLSQFFGRMIESGNPLGQLSFSRENEAQADRLGVHIAYDAGFSPDGLVGMFRTFESMSPSSRNSWDLMTRTHPFSVDRANTVTDYAALLPPRAPHRDAAGFTTMKARLARLAPAPDAVGQLKSGTQPGQATPKKQVPSEGSLANATRDFSINGTPITGEIPADWGARQSDSGTIIFEGPQGSESYAMSVELEVVPKTRSSGSLGELARLVRDRLSQRPNARIDPPTSTPTTRALGAMIVSGAFNMTVSGRTVPFHDVAAIVEYQDHFMILSYYGPDVYFDKYAPVYQAIARSIKYRGR